MRYTNLFNLPDSIVRAITSDDYDHPKDRYTIPANRLIAPIKQMLLRSRHDDDIVEDVSDNVWRLFGTSLHYILDKQESNEVVKRRLEACLGDFTITGKPDCYNPNTKTLLDYKVTSAWTFVFNSEEGKREWIEQLNIYNWLISKNGYEVSKAQIIAILRDWNYRDQQKSIDYPLVPVQSLDIVLWSTQEQESFIENKLELIRKYMDAPDDSIPECTPEERWQEPTTWAFYKKEGDEKAYRVMKTEEDSVKFEAENPKLLKVVRKGVDKRCCRYCNVSKFCNYYKSNYSESNQKEA